MFQKSDISPMQYFFLKILQVVDEYNKRKKDIVRYQAEIGQREEAQKRHQEEIEDIKTRWIDPLQELISKINKNFSSFFKSMQCAGEVDLHVPENPVRYSFFQSHT